MKVFEVEINAGMMTITTNIEARDEMGVIDFLTREPYVISNQDRMVVIVSSHIDGFKIKEAR